MSIKEQYWKYSLIVIILFMGIIIFRQITPFLGGLLGALTIYILVRTQMTHLTEKWKLKRSVAALLITAETVMVFLVPLGLTIWLLVNQLQDINLDPQTFIAPMQQVAEFIKEKTGYDVLGKDTLSFIVSILPRIGQIIMESISSLAINLFVMVFVLYFMLIGGKKMEAYVNDILPFNEANTQEVIHEINMIVRSNAIGIPLLAIPKARLRTSSPRRAFTSFHRYKSCVPPALMSPCGPKDAIHRRFGVCGQILKRQGRRPPFRFFHTCIKGLHSIPGQQS